MFEHALHAASRAKRRLHAATAPRTPDATGPIDVSSQILDVVFPDGLARDHAELAQRILGESGATAQSIRKLIGHIDQQRSPSPFTAHLTAADVAYLAVGGQELALDTSDLSVSLPTLHDGWWEPHVECVIRRFLEPGATFIDIGANVGYHTLVASQIVGARGRVIAFEPNAENARLIAHTIEHNDIGNITLLPVALAAEQGFAVFRHAIGSNGGFADSDSSSLLEPNTTIVPTIALDDLDLASLDVESVDLIKIDVEGAEPIVFAGAAELLARHRPVLIFEFSIEMTERVGGVAAADYLESIVRAGYELFLVGRPSGELEPIGPVSEFLDGWGDRGRIDDLVARPTGDVDR